MGLQVDHSGLFTGTEDHIRGELPGVGDIVLSERPGGILEVIYTTELLGT